jgi:hypothetical protein
MSRFDRIVRRNGRRECRRLLERNRELSRVADHDDQARQMGLSKCPNCNAYILARIWDSSGDYDLCVECGVIIPKSMEDE